MYRRHFCHLADVICHKYLANDTAWDLPLHGQSDCKAPEKLNTTSSSALEVEHSSAPVLIGAARRLIIPPQSGLRDLVLPRLADSVILKN